MKRKEVEVLGEQTNAVVIKLPERRFPGVVLQGDSLHNLEELAAKVGDALSEGRDPGEDAAELHERLEGYVCAYEDALARAGMELPYVKRPRTDPPRDEEAGPDSTPRGAGARPARAPVGPWHDFYLLPEETEPYAGYRKWIRGPGSVRLSDEIISHLYESLEWIPTLNPANAKEWGGYGINRWGPTVIHRDGAPTAQRVFSAWAELFSAGPAELVLPGEWVFGPGDEEGYQRLLVSRDEIVQQMRTLAEYAERSAGGEAYILHIGV